MQRPELWTFALLVTLASCQGGHDDPHAGHDTTEQNSADAGKEAECAGRGEPLSDVVLTSQDASVNATLALVSATPERPIVGNNSWLFDLTIDGEPAAGLESVIAVTPFMPDHGHGTPTIVRVEEVETGRYKLEPVHTRMAGYWEVTVLVDAPAGELSFVVKVCVD